MPVSHLCPDGIFGPARKQADSRLYFYRYRKIPQITIRGKLLLFGKKGRPGL
jgi:hypothetical protein